MPTDARIHIRIPKGLKRAAKVKAAQTNTTLTAVINAHLTKWANYQPPEEPSTLP